ncbi:MAG: 23S rRNA pseudouridine(955/2504/2580) synthase RluC [Gammaproteobacteria bacterium]|nr:23S rRNA pseudouridine(955/2504/2580) synthase RluC [Gammaproteobacteria bacterium]
MSEQANISHSVRMIRIEPDRAGQRIDNFLLGFLKGVPRSYVYRILRKGEVRVNKGRIKASYKLNDGDIVRIPPVKTAEKESTNAPGQRLLSRIDKAVIHEDNQLLVLNKPAGIAVHGGSGLNHGVIEGLRILRPKEQQLELVHRLDRETSGCLLVAKRRSALRMLHELLRTNGVDKRYLALVAGQWDQNRVEVDAPLLKNTVKSGERLVKVDSRGKAARTRFSVVERFNDFTLVEAKLLTGRTHQIRVHTAHLGSPILGDPKYGDDELNRMIKGRGVKRMFLHAAAISFRWPDSEELERFEAPLEQELKSLLESLRRE